MQTGTIVYRNDEAVALTWEERAGQMGGTAPDSTTKYATTANSTATKQDTTGRHVCEMDGLGAN